MTREVEINIFVISTQWRAVSTQFCLTLMQPMTGSFEGRGLSRGGGGLLEDLR